MSIIPYHIADCLYISSISTGFIDVPGNISLNIYASGCRKRCTHCQNEQLQTFNTAHPLTPDTFKSTMDHYIMANWICFLGGDAVYQPNGLNCIAKAAKINSKRVCLYTGLNFSELININKDLFDLIIDGEYDESLGGISSPSTNQKCYINKNGVWSIHPFDTIKQELM